jgi:uncharacterized protein YbjT (DUF2867 family)
MPVPLRTAVVLGATGLVGGRLLRLLANDSEVESVVALGRRASGLTQADAPKVRDVTVDLASPDAYREHLGVDCVFSALGTTIKKAGSEGAFRMVDLEYPLAVATAASAAGARRYVIVTAVGADATSGIFYNRVKGELEDALRQLRFERGLRIVHPSILLGDRQESRPGEHVAAAFMRATAPLFAGGLKKWRAVDADDVAKAMVTAARSEGDGVRVYEGASLFEAAAGRG